MKIKYQKLNLAGKETKNWVGNHWTYICGVWLYMDANDAQMSVFCVN